MSDQNAQLSASLEDYLEAIFRIVSKKSAARGRDIAKALGVRAASVTGALRLLAERKLIHYAPYEVITLTPEGRKEAEKIIQKHEVLKGFFTTLLGLDEDMAEEGACRLEHGLAQPIMERLLAFTEFVQACPRCGEDWRSQFLDRCTARSKPPCAECLTGCQERLRRAATEVKDAVPQPLTEIQPGVKCVVKSIKNRRTVARRLIEMGVQRGTLVEIKRVAPLGDPIAVKVRGYHLSLRLEEAKSIEVVPA
ncbi:MAG: metal-dependent transcriptional regulator [Phycisphaerales bacterium]|nr:MAG: metal-dependent transcriptional regulator [Phycisphaerales bacterium]